MTTVPDPAGTAAPALGNVVVAVSGVLGSGLLVWAGTRQRLGIGLLAIVLLAVTTAVAAHTAVVADRPGRPRRVVGGLVAVVATGLFLAFASSEASVLVPVVALGAGIGRTRRWWLRVVAVGSLLAVVALPL